MIYLYLTTIVISNIITAMIAPLVLFNGLMIVPVGSVFVGLTFILRDLVQMRYGKKITYLVIVAASALSALASFCLGDTTLIAIASLCSFVISEAIDTEIFSRLRRSIVARITLSGVVGGIVDSAIFVVVGLSPIGSNILTWEQVPYAMISQATVKSVAQLIVMVVYLLWSQRKSM